MHSFRDSLAIRLLTSRRALRGASDRMMRAIAPTARRRSTAVVTAAIVAGVAGYMLRPDGEKPVDPPAIETRFAEIEFGRGPTVHDANRPGHFGRADHPPVEDWESPSPGALVDANDPYARLSSTPVRSAYFERPAGTGGAVWLTGTIEDPADRLDLGR